jgi:filamentous hemagglutinin family protein
MKGTPASFLCCLLLTVGTAAAEILRDGTVGPGAGVQPLGPDYRIGERMGELRGANLFHSFARFDLEAGESALFSADSPVHNLIARITGDGASDINGKVGSDIPGVNLYLLNPRGFLLGPAAEIQVEGSLHLGAGDHLRFSDGSRFPGRTTSGTLLSAAEPAAFGFLDAGAGAIALSGARLSVGTGRTLLLAGSGIVLEGEPGEPLLEAPSGHVALFAVDSAGEVRLGQDPRAAGFTRMGAIRLSTVDGPEDEPPGMPEEDGDDGAEGELSSQIDVSGDPAGRVSLLGSELRVRDFLVAADTLGDRDARNGGIRVQVTGLAELSGASGFVSSSQAAGSGGAVIVRAREIRILDESELLSDALAEGAGGRVELYADTLLLDGDAELATDAVSSGHGGDVLIEVGALTLQGNAEISSDTDPQSTAQGGNVHIRAARSLLLRIEGDEPAGIFTNSEGAGDAGDIVIDTPLLTLEGGVITAETSGRGAGGRVSIRATHIDLDRGAAISALSSGEFAGAGDAGDISLRGLETLSVRGASGVITRSSFSDGGNIAITATGLVQVRGGLLSANVNDGVGGNLDVTGDTLVLHDAAVVAQAGAGRGGNIAIASRRFLSSESLISASAQTGISGTVNIDAPLIDLSSGLAPLTTEFQDAATLLEVTCASQEQEDASSFVVTTRRGLPAGDDGLPLGRPGLVRNGQPVLTTPQTQPWLGLTGQARVALEQGRLEQAREYLTLAEQGLADSPAAVARVHAWLKWTGVTLGLAERLPRERNALRLRVHGRLLQARADAENLAEPRALSYVLGNLALLYQSDRRSEEALYLARLAQRAAEQANAPESLYRWYWLRGRLLWSLGRSDDALAALRAAVAILDETRQEAFVDSADTDFFRLRISPVYLDLVDALLQSSDRVATDTAPVLWREARSVIDRFRSAELREYFHDPCMSARQSQRTGVDAMAGQAVIVYPIILPERLELLVTLPSGIRRYVSPVAAEHLERTAEALRSALQSGRDDYRAPARQLYDWLIRPYAAELSGERPRTLVLVPGGPLRGVPLAALMNGDRFLVQDYALAVTPGLELVDPQPLPPRGLPSLLAGVSEAVQGFTPLPGVSDELQELHAILRGEMLLNQAFSTQAFSEALQKQQPGLVHIASHAHFGGRPEDNFVLAYDRHLDMRRLTELVGVTRFRDQPLELLVLSACQTAVGDSRAVLGLAGVAVRAGARSALGSLWSISDAATAELMKVFYHQLQQPGVTRAGALQRAQQALLDSPNFHHPSYWSAFLLVNNWL